MAEYHFDTLAKKAGITVSSTAPVLSREEAERAMHSISFRFSITDGYLVEKGGQFDYVFDFSRHTFERSDWRSGVPAVVKGRFRIGRRTISSRPFPLSYPAADPLCDEHEIHGSEYQCLGAREVRAHQAVYPLRGTHGEHFFRWVAEKDGDSPFKELYDALTALRAAVD